MEKREVCWLITTRCNQHCRYCHSFLNIEDLTYEENKEILMKLIRAGVNYITWSGGEALLYPNIIELLKIAKQYGIKNKLITNGSIIANNVKNREILNYLDTITLSLDTIDEGINEKMGRGRKHFFEVQEVLNILKDKKIKVTINTVVNKFNINHLDDLGKFLNDNHKIDEWRIFKFIPLREVAKENQKIFEITNEQFESTKKIFQSYKNIRNIKYRNDEDMESKYILITANGDIVRTVNKIDVVIGNALKQNLKEIIKVMNEDSNRNYLIDKIKVLISYNDIKVVDRFVKTIDKLNYAEVVATAENSIETYDKIMKLRPDVVFAKYDFEVIKKSEENLEQNSPIFNLITQNITNEELQKAIEVSGNKVYALIREPYEKRIETILQDFRENINK